MNASSLHEAAGMGRRLVGGSGGVRCAAAPARVSSVSGAGVVDLLVPQPFAHAPALRWGRYASGTIRRSIRPSSHAAMSSTTSVKNTR